MSVAVVDQVAPEEEAVLYEPRGAARELFHRRDPEIVTAGPADTGKSRGCLEKINLCAEKYPGMRALIVRKSRESLSETVLVTFENIVLGPNHPLTLGASRHNRQVYTYANGSEIVVGGMDSDPPCTFGQVRNGVDTEMGGHAQNGKSSFSARRYASSTQG